MFYKIFSFFSSDGGTKVGVLYGTGKLIGRNGWQQTINWKKVLETGLNNPVIFVFKNEIKMTHIFCFFGDHLLKTKASAKASLPAFAIDTNEQTTDK